MHERKIKRYGAYFFGWCQAFGEHEITYEEEHDIYWLFSESRIGITVAPRLRRRALKEILKQVDNPTITLSYSHARLNDLTYTPQTEQDREGLRQVVDFLTRNDAAHVFLTNHFCYPPGTKILTLSNKSPLLILYKEIPPLTVRIE
ncbi:MAG: hypothetical protein H6970_02330 [Gammaproteobacteria bacterium]|nr:hypothetical protein [Gammaproteobacteria bacterium]MCP5423895.1 hypothetical protein [Gammaproteobacteria bacterium]